MIDMYETVQRAAGPSLDGLRGGASSSRGAAPPASAIATNVDIHLDLIYVTEKIISISFPAVGVADAAYRWLFTWVVLSDGDNQLRW